MAFNDVPSALEVSNIKCHTTYQRFSPQTFKSFCNLRSRIYEQSILAVTAT